MTPMSHTNFKLKEHKCQEHQHSWECVNSVRWFLLFEQMSQWVFFFYSVIYLFKHLFSEKMTPHDLSTPPSPALDPEEVRSRKMNRRAKVIQELVQTEGDYLKDLELCIQEVVQPLRNLQVHAFLHFYRIRWSRVDRKYTWLRVWTPMRVTSTPCDNT